MVIGTSKTSPFGCGDGHGGGRSTEQARPCAAQMNGSETFVEGRWVMLTATANLAPPSAKKTRRVSLRAVPFQRQYQFQRRNSVVTPTSASSRQTSHASQASHASQTSHSRQTPPASRSAPDHAQQHAASPTKAHDAGASTAGGSSPHIRGEQAQKLNTMAHSEPAQGRSAGGGYSASQSGGTRDSSANGKAVKTAAAQSSSMGSNRSQPPGDTGREPTNEPRVQTGQNGQTGEAGYSSGYGASQRAPHDESAAAHEPAGTPASNGGGGEPVDPESNSGAAPGEAHQDSDPGAAGAATGGNTPSASHVTVTGDNGHFYESAANELLQNQGTNPDGALAAFKQIEDAKVKINIVDGDVSTGFDAKTNTVNWNRTKDSAGESVGGYSPESVGLARALVDAAGSHASKNGADDASGSGPSTPEASGAAAGPVESEATGGGSYAAGRAPAPEPEVGGSQDDHFASGTGSNTASAQGQAR